MCHFCILPCLVAAQKNGWSKKDYQESPSPPGWGHRGVSLYQLSRYSRDPQAAGVWGVGPEQQLGIKSHKQITVHSRTESKYLSL